MRGASPVRGVSPVRRASSLCRADNFFAITWNSFSPAKRASPLESHHMIKSTARFTEISGSRSGLARFSCDHEHKNTRLS